MPLTSIAKETIERPLPPEKIKKRPGKAGMTYDYVTPDFVISLLNEAFDYKWSTRVVSHAMYGDTAVVGLELEVCDDAGYPISKQQFGSCEPKKGMGPGEAFKSAASDALKKAATLLGVALELYQDDDAPVEAGFKKPTVPAPRPPLRTPSQTPGPPKAPLAAPAPPAPPAPTAAPAPPAAPAVPAAPAPPKPSNPFANGGNRTTAAVPKPAAPPAAPPAPALPTAAPAVKANPFASKNEASGPNPTQLNALVNLANRKEISQPDMIALANIADEVGDPKQSFEDLTHAEAIQVIKASQL